MIAHSTKATRADSARINGAKSKGPKSPEGMYRSQTASQKHGLYAVRGYRLPGESNREYAELQAQMHAYWQPKGYFDQHLVEELVGNLWEAKRLQASKNDYLHDELAAITRNSPHCKDQAKLNLEAEKKVTVAGGSMDKFNARVSHFARERHRLEGELLRLEKRSCTSGPSQMSLKINNRQHPDIPASANAKPVNGVQSEAPYIVEAPGRPLPGNRFEPEPEPETQPNIIDWAAVALDFHPDEYQTEILTEMHNRILVLAPRQTGKSTAVAVRVLFEAMCHDDAVILLASASGRQSGQIMEKVRKMAKSLDLEILPPPPKCDGFTLANGAEIVALPDNEETIRGFSAPRMIVVDEAAFASEAVFKALEPMLTVSNGTFILLSTPNGQTGYFYDQWHAEDSPWTKLKGSLERCPRVNLAAIEAMRKTTAKEVFAQEFECKFVASGGQIISLETLRKCYRDDFDLFDPEYDLEGKD